MTQKNDVFDPPKSRRCMSRKKTSEKVQVALKISVADLCGPGREKQTPHPPLTSAWQEIPHGIDYVPGIPRPPFSCPLLDFSVYRLTGMYLSAQGYASVSHLNQNTSLLCLSVSLFFLSHVLPSQLIMKILVPQSLVPSCHMSVIALQIQVFFPLFFFFFVLTLFLQRSLSL